MDSENESRLDTTGVKQLLTITKIQNAGTPEIQLVVQSNALSPPLICGDGAYIDAVFYIHTAV